MVAGGRRSPSQGAPGQEPDCGPVFYQLANYYPEVDPLFKDEEQIEVYLAGIPALEKTRAQYQAFYIAQAVSALFRPS